MVNRSPKGRLSEENCCAISNYPLSFVEDAQRCSPDVEIFRYVVCVGVYREPLWVMALPWIAL